MLGSILEIIDNDVIVDLAIDITKQPNIVGLHVIFEDNNKMIVGEIENVNRETMKVKIVGEFVAGKFMPGINSRPSFNANIRIVDMNELASLLGPQQTTDNTLFLGYSNVYDKYRINVEINPFFSNHFAILGNSGSGKSFTVASIFQSLFEKNNPPFGANIFMFDAYGEYTRAFGGIHDLDNRLNYKVYTTDIEDKSGTPILKIPLWLMDVDDLALLLDVSTPNQLPIIEKTLKLVPVLLGNNPNAIKHKNDIIARALQEILLSGDESTKIRDQITAILTKFNTAELNLESKIVEPGYVRTLKQCLFIDKTGKMQEMELVTKFISTFINDNLVLDMPSDKSFYTLKDLEQAMEFALISEGMLKSNRVYDLANVLLVRLHAIANGPVGTYFSYPRYIDKPNFIMDLVSMNGAKCQVVNFNISYVDDRIAKVITKIISRMLFTQALVMKKRGSMPYHIIIEEAHRYVQKDADTEILGYNIFERITKEGRKYGTILGLITQRPSELSDTVVSQCANFIVLKMSHPKDLNYIKTMVPNVSEEIIEKLKNLKPGNCVAFGQAFKIPLNARVEAPDPPPLSDNVDMVKQWHTLVNLTEENKPVATANVAQPTNNGNPVLMNNQQQVSAVPNPQVAPVPNQIPSGQKNPFE